MRAPSLEYFQASLFFGAIVHFLIISIQTPFRRIEPAALSCACRVLRTPSKQTAVPLSAGSCVLKSMRIITFITLLVAFGLSTEVKARRITVNRPSSHTGGSQLQQQQPHDPQRQWQPSSPLVSLVKVGVSDETLVGEPYLVIGVTLSSIKYCFCYREDFTVCVCMPSAVQTDDRLSAHVSCFMFHVLANASQYILLT